MPSASDNPIPEIYVLWHPACRMGGLIARRIHAWLRPGNGLGPQVFYRCLPGPESPPGGLPLPLPGEKPRAGLMPTPAQARFANQQIVVVLIDDHLVADAAWRHWLGQIALPGNAEGLRTLMPVALDSTAYNIVEPLRELNFLRPAGLPLPDFEAAPETARESIIRSLLRQLTEAMCRLMLGRTRNGSPPPKNEMGPTKIKIFLSHAKADGTTPAKRIRDYIYSQTQFAAFYDENDIPFGSSFSRTLLNDIQSEDTAALIAVRSARYAARPWCRRELSLFRRPIREAVVSTSERWRLNPVLVVDALEGGSQSAGIHELGNARVIRWADVPEQEEQIVTTLLRETLLAAFHCAVGRSLPEAADQIVLNWLPDPGTLLQIPRVREGQDVKIAYPGRGLSGLELDVLDELFPHVEFHSFEEVLA